MRVKQLNVIGLLFLVLMGVSVSAQEMHIPTKKEIKIINNDSTIITEVLVNSDIPKIEEFKRYYWYNKDAIKSNLGGYYGRLLHGDFRLFKEDKLILSGEFKNGLKTGTWKRWRKDGGYAEIIEWEEGLLHGNYVNYDAKGKQISNVEYKEGEKHGAYQKWNSKGKLIESGYYRKGKKYKRTTFYLESGERRIVRYRNGEELKPKAVKSKSEKENKVDSDKKENWFKNLFKKKEELDKEESKAKKEIVEKKEPFYKKWFKKREDKE